tara:strand:- start:8 stop:265 length:258 start_codon:yes stop_codon:yes gene_type:complete
MLKTSLFKNLKKKFNQNSCSICLKLFKINDKIYEIICDHIYHIDCIEKWFILNNTRCPVCLQEDLVANLYIMIKILENKEDSSKK